MKIDWKRKTAVVLAAATLITTVCYGYGTGGVREVKAETAQLQATGISVAAHSREEIRAYLREHPVNLKQFGNPVSFEQEPVTVSPYSPGKLSAETNERALTALNAIRYIAGIPDDVVLDDTYEAQVQAGALVNYVNGEMSHTPSQPADMAEELYKLGYEGTSSSNIAWASWNSASFEYTLVHSWMADDDENNIDRVGHRRWILNPEMGKTGFGAVNGSKGTYSGMYSFDCSGNVSASGVCWPAQTMPLEFFGNEYPWSISMGTSVDASQVRVTLTRKGDGQTWHFSSSQSDGAFYVNNDYYGQPGCIIFRPEGIAYQDGDIFEVEISGMAQAVSYEVEFFALEEAKPSASPGVAPTLKPGIRPTAKPSATPGETSSESSDFVYEDYGENNVIITDYTGTDTIVRVPEEIDGKTVYAVGDAFRGNTELEEVYLPETLTELYPAAFQGCSNLRVVDVGGFSYVTSFLPTKSLFSGCVSLEKFMTGDTADFPIYSNDTTVDLFSREILDKIRYIYLGDKMSDVSERLFYGKSLEWVEIGENNPTYSSRDGIVYSADGKTLIVCGTSYSEEEVEIPYGVETIGNIGFEGCTGIRKVKIPETVTSIPNNAFWGLDVTIEAKENSYAAQYALASGIPFEQDGDALPENTSQPTEAPTEAPAGSPSGSPVPSPGTGMITVPTEKPAGNPLQSLTPSARPQGSGSTSAGKEAAGAVIQPGTAPGQKDISNAGIVTPRPKKAVIRSLKSTKSHKVQIVLKKLKEANGYQIQYGTKKNMKQAKSISVKKSRAVLKNLKKNRTYYVRARAYRTEHGRRNYGAWSSRKKIKVR